jgi:hypothetical protein
MKGLSNVDIKKRLMQIVILGIIILVGIAIAQAFNI